MNILDTSTDSLDTSTIDLTNVLDTSTNGEDISFSNARSSENYNETIHSKENTPVGIKYGEKKYKCSECPKGYTQSHSLKQHMYKIHPGATEDVKKGDDNVLKQKPKKTKKRCGTCSNCRR